MIRVYLITPDEIPVFLSDADTLNIKSVSLVHDDAAVNVIAIVEGQEAEKLTGFYMLPGYVLSREVETIPNNEIEKISQDLNDRGIVTSGSITVGDLLDNMCLALNSDFKGLGDITTRDFN